MRKICFVVAALLLAVIAVPAKSPAPKPLQDNDKIERGKYLVEEVGKCGDCHTPRTETGEPDMTRNMKGATLNVAPINPIKGWHKDAPGITPSGKLWSRWGREGMVNFLVKGTNPRGGKAEPPMATYHLKPEDAEAMVAYLETLK